MSTPLVEQLKSVLESLKAIDSVALFEKFGFDYDSIPVAHKENIPVAVNEIQVKSKKVFLYVADESNFSDFQIESVTEFVSDCRTMLLDRESFANSKEILTVLRNISGGLSGLIVTIGETKGIRR